MTTFMRLFVVAISFFSLAAAAAEKPLERLPGKAHYLLGTDPEGFVLDVPTYRKVVEVENAPAQLGAFGPTLARDGAGRLYVAGHADEQTVFLTQLDRSGVMVLRTSYVDGFAPDTALTLAVAPDGEAVLAGTGEGKAVVVRVAADGRSIVSRGAFGEKTAALAVTLDANGNAWVAGRDRADAFIAQLDRAGAILSASTVANSEATGIALDGAGNVYLTGSRGADALVAKIDAHGTLVFAVPFGGSDLDAGAAIALTPSGDVVVAGTTRSEDLPVMRGMGPRGGESDAFLATLHPDSGSLLFSTYAGGLEDDRALALAVDRVGVAWIAGSRGADAFVSRVDPERTDILAGESKEIASGLVLDANGDAWVAGLTRSQELPAVSRPEIVLGGDVFLARLPSGVCPGTKSFTGAVSLSWGISQNWSGGTLPVSTDDVCISGFNVTIDSGTRSVNSLRVENGSLTISGGTLTLAADSEINGPLTVTVPGIVNGAGNLTVGGTFTWSGGSVIGTGSLTTNGAVSLNNNFAITLMRVWNANGAVTWTGANTISASGATINNASTWDCQGTGTINSGNFNNTGTVKKTAGTGASTLAMVFNNTGSVLGQFNVISLNNGGTSTGSFDASAGATVRFGGGNHLINAGTTFTGSGTIEVGGAGVTPNTPISIPSTLTLALTGGVLGGGPGTGDVTTAGTFRWTGGTLLGPSSGTPAMTSNGPMLISAGTTKTLNGRHLHVNGGAVMTDGLSMTSACVIHNKSGSTFDIQNDVEFAIAGNPTPRINNAGTFKKSGGVGSTSVPFVIDNSGSLQVGSGTLDLMHDNPNTGSIDVSAGGALQSSAGALRLNAGTTVTGAGIVAVTGVGQLVVNTAVGMPAGITLQLLSGFVQGPGTLTLAGTLDWYGGGMSGSTTGSGPIVCNGFLNIYSGVGKQLSLRTLNVNGTATFLSESTLSLSGGQINNTGTWDHQSDGPIIKVGTAVSSFNNSGTFKRRVSGNAVALQVPFNNSGTVEVRSGSLSIEGHPYTQTAGATQLIGTGFASQLSTSIQGGTLSGYGTVSGATVAVSGTGAISPGASPGTLTIDTAYTQQGANTAMNIELGGTSAGAQYDRIDISGAATLGGKLNVSLIDGFVPAPGNSFVIATYASRTGTFGTVSLPAVPCVNWQLNYGATALTLTAVAGAPPAEIAQLVAPTDDTLSWAASPAAGATYDVLRGTLSSLPVGPGAGEVCLAATGATTTDASTPAAGEGYWYVVRAKVGNTCAGTYGFATGGVERVSTACP